jgi:archaemetzincin
MFVSLLEILPIGEFQHYWLAHLRGRLEEFFGNVEISPPAGFPLKFNERGQVLADHLLDRLNCYPARGERVLAVVNRDITVGGVDYIFGLAALGGRCAVVSPVRLREANSGGCNHGLFLERLLKEAMHELGHTLGLSHCSNDSCNMKFSSTVYDIDRKSVLFCNDCLKKISGYAKTCDKRVYAANGNKNLAKVLLERLGGQADNLR